MDALSGEQLETVVSADGTPIAVWRSGNGPPLVLVHVTYRKLESLVAGARLAAAGDGDP